MGVVPGVGISVCKTQLHRLITKFRDMTQRRKNNEEEKWYVVWNVNVYNV